METEKKLQVVRQVYAAVLAENVKHLAAAGALERVTAQKREEQLAGGKAKAAAFGITEPAEAFTRTAELFDCADWRVDEEEGGWRARAGRCLLCAMARRLGSPSPCRIYCLDPIEGMVRGVSPGVRLEVEQTLFDGTCCAVRLRRE